MVRADTLVTLFSKTSDEDPGWRPRNASTQPIILVEHSRTNISDRADFEI